MNGTWPPELDAAIAAPNYHQQLLENDSVRVLDTKIEPGETVPLHTHQWPAAYYVLSWGDFIRRDAEGNITLDSRALESVPESGEVIWAQPLGPHTLENVGNSTIHIVSIEVKIGPP